jgi:integrase
MTSLVRFPLFPGGSSDIHSLRAQFVAGSHMPRPRQTRPALTKRVIDAAQARPQRYLIFDGDVHGFALKVEPTGRKVFLVQKAVGGRTVRVTIATYPDLTLDQARREAQTIVAKLARGGDPTAERREAMAARQRASRDSFTVADLWVRYLAEEIGPRNKASTAALKRRLWRSSIEPAIGRLPLREVTGADVSALVRAPLRFDGKGQLVGGKAASGNLYRLLHHLFGKALAWRLRPLELGHPLDGVEQPRVPRRERLLSDGEVGALLRELDRSEQAGDEKPQIVAACRLVALTGWRVSEILTLRWVFVRRDLAEAHLPDTKTGFLVRPLAPAALAVLDGIERRPGVPWVLPGVRDPERPLNYDTLHKAFARIAARAGVRGVTPHTLRHRVTTDVAGASPNIRTGMAVTGHKSVQAYLGYVHAEKSRAQAVAAEVAAKVSGLAARAPDDKVAELRPRRRTSRG